MEGVGGCYVVTTTCGRVMLRRYWKVEGWWWVRGRAFDIKGSGRKEQRVATQHQQQRTATTGRKAPTSRRNHRYHHHHVRSTQKKHKQLERKKLERLTYSHLAGNCQAQFVYSCPSCWGHRRNSFRPATRGAPGRGRGSASPPPPTPPPRPGTPPPR